MKARENLYLNPNFVKKQRDGDVKSVAAIRERVTMINAKLASLRSRRTNSSALSEVGALIRKHKLGGLLSVELKTSPHGHALRLIDNDHAWGAAAVATPSPSRDREGLPHHPERA